MVKLAAKFLSIDERLWETKTRGLTENQSEQEGKSIHPLKETEQGLYRLIQRNFNIKLKYQNELK